MYKLLFIILCGLMSVFNIKAGTEDSLYQKIKNSTNDTVKGRARYLLIDYYLHKVYKYKIALNHCDTLIEFSKQKKLDKLLFRGWLYKAYCFQYLAEYDEAIRFDSIALAIAQKKKFKKETADALQNMGNNFANKGNTTVALDCYLNSLKINEELKDSLSMALLYHNTAIIYAKIGQVNKALNFYKTAAIIRTIKKSKALASTLCSIGNVFARDQKNDSAIFYYNRGLAIAKVNGDIQTVLNIQGNLASIYINTNEYAPAEKYLFDNMRIFKNIGEKQGLSRVYYSLAALYAKMGRKVPALDYANKSLVLTEEGGLTEDKEEAYSTMAEISAMFKEYETAYLYRTKELKFKDSLYKISSVAKMAEMSQKYDAEKRQKELELLTEKSVNQELAISNNRLFMFGGGVLILLLVLIAFVLVRSNRIKQQVNHKLELQNNIIEDKNKETEHQKEIIEEKQKEILASIHYAKRIQNALITSEIYIDRSLKKLMK